MLRETLFLGGEPKMRANNIRIEYEHERHRGIVWNGCMTGTANGSHGNPEPIPVDPNKRRKERGKVSPKKKSETFDNNVNTWINLVRFASLFGLLQPKWKSNIQSNDCFAPTILYFSGLLFFVLFQFVSLLLLLCPCHIQLFHSVGLDPN